MAGSANPEPETSTFPSGEIVQGGHASISLRFRLPDLLIGGEIEALDAVALVPLVRMRQIKPPVVGRETGRAEMARTREMG